MAKSAFSAISDYLAISIIWAVLEKTAISLITATPAISALSAISTIDTFGMFDSSGIIGRVRNNGYSDILQSRQFW